MNVYIWKGDITDTQGPAPSGFHIPLTTEWQGLKTIMDGLGLTTGDNWRINLHIPFAGRRNQSDADILYQGARGYCWSSSPYGPEYPTYVRGLYLSSSVNVDYYSIRAIGYPVRCFKDLFELPTSSWTVINGTLGGAGIFRNQTDGLISITSDGTTGYTIQDKNLGATTVYNDGDTLTQANMGNMYQWGNNYGFPSTGSVTISSTKVDASNYGPGNYYSSSTFITSGNDWSSVQNDNLRGGVSGLGGESELKNAYIGEAPYEGNELCFTANTAGSTIKLTKNGTPTDVTLETSTDGRNWSTYTFGDIITLSNVGDKVYWRNTSTTDTGFSINTNNSYYRFEMTGSISGSGDVNYLLNKNSTTTVSSCCFYNLFNGGNKLTSAPILPATTLAENCYNQMFAGCTSLTTAPTLPATTLVGGCYYAMFSSCTNLESIPKLNATTYPDYSCAAMFINCSKIKLSTTQTGAYQTAYRIPTTGTGTTVSNALTNMFYGTGGTFTGAPSINKTYYTSNTVV